MTDDHFRYVDAGAIRDFDEFIEPLSAYWFLVPADGNDAEALIQLLQAADEWAAGGDKAPVYAAHHADQIHALLDSIRRSFDAHT